MTDMQEKTEEQLEAEWKAYCMNLCRTKRDSLIAETDFIHMPDVTVSEDYKQSLLTYRQELRDFPATFEALYDAMAEDEKSGITDLSMPWPTKP